MQRTKFILAAVFLLCELASVSEASTNTGAAGTGTRTFPAEKPFKDWTSDDFTTYVTELAIQSGGFGVGIGLLFSISMFFHLCCWGACCECFRCCCCKLDNHRESSCFQKKNRKFSLLAALIFFVISLAGVGIIFSNTDTLYPKIDTMFDNVYDTISESENLMCPGSLPAAFASGMSEDQAVAQAGGSYMASMGTCSGGTSLGSFLFKSAVKLNETTDSILNLIETSQNLLTALDEVESAVRNSSILAKNVSATLVTFETRAAGVKTALDDIYQRNPALNSGLITTSSAIPTPTTQDKTTVSYIAEGLDSAAAGVKDARDTLDQPIATDLGVTARNDVQKAKKTMIDGLVSLAKNIVQGTEELADARKSVKSADDTVQGTASIGRYVMAAIYGVSVVILFQMLLGYVFGKRCCISCGGYESLLIFFWLSCLLGIFLVLAMILYDVCGCEGEYTVAGCLTMRTLISANIGNSSHSFGSGAQKTIVTTASIFDDRNSLISCPDHTNATGFYEYSENSNFVDVLGIARAFNFTGDIQPAKDTLTSAVSKVAVPLTNETAALETAATSMNGVQVGLTHNFSSDLRGYQDTLNLLTSPQAPTAYPTPPPVSVNQDNIASLTNLTSLNMELESVRDTFAYQRSQFGVRVDTALTNLRAVNTSLQELKTNLLVSADKLSELANHVMTINRYTPCAVVGNFYSKIVVGDICENMFLTIDGVTPGAILCLLGMLLGFFLLLMMRDCVLLAEEEEDMHLVEEEMKRAAGQGRIGGGGVGFRPPEPGGQPPNSRSAKYSIGGSHQGNGNGESLTYHSSQKDDTVVATAL